MRKVLLTMWALGASGAWAQEAGEPPSTEAGDSESPLESEASLEENPVLDEVAPEAAVENTESDAMEQSEPDQSDDSQPADSAERATVTNVLLRTASFRLMG